MRRILLLFACLAANSGALACIDGRMEEVALTPERRVYHEQQLKSTRQTIRELESKKAPRGQIDTWKRGAAQIEQILASGREEVFRPMQAKRAPGAETAKAETAKAPTGNCSG